MSGVLRNGDVDQRLHRASYGRYAKRVSAFFLNGFVIRFVIEDEKP